MSARAQPMRARWLFLALFGAFAMPGRFTPLFYAAHGQPESRIGLLVSMQPLMAVAAGPFFCNLADRTGRRERVTALSYLAATAAFTIQAAALPSLALIPPAARFPWLMFWRVLFSIFCAPVYPLVNAIAISQLKEEYGDEGHGRFGTERLWGAVSWATCAFGLGVFLDLPGVGPAAVYAAKTVFGLIFIWTLMAFERSRESNQCPGKLPVDEVVKARDKSPLLKDVGVRGPEDARETYGAVGNETASYDVEPEDSMPRPASMSALKAYGRILSSGGLSTIMFFNLLLCIYPGMSIDENLLFLFFKKELNASNLVCGLTVVITVLFELPFFAFAPQLLARYGSANLAMVGCLAFAVRGFGYAASPNVWFALLVEPLHGLTYATVTTSAISFVAERTPRELEATGQSLVDLVYASGCAVGAAVGGYIIQNFGSKALYKGASILVLLATLAFAYTNLAIRLRGTMHPVAVHGCVRREAMTARKEEKKKSRKPDCGDEKSRVPCLEGELDGI